MLIFALRLSTAHATIDMSRTSACTASPQPNVNVDLQFFTVWQVLLWTWYPLGTTLAVMHLRESNCVPIKINYIDTTIFSVVVFASRLNYIMNCLAAGCSQLIQGRNIRIRLCHFAGDCTVGNLDSRVKEKIDLFHFHDVINNQTKKK